MGGAALMGVTCPSSAVGMPTSLFLQLSREADLPKEQERMLTELLGNESDFQIFDRALKATRALQEAKLAKDFDPKEFEVLAADASRAETALLHHQVQTWKGIRSILTAEQTKSVMQKMMPPGMGPMGPGGMPGPGGPPPGGPPPGPGGPR
jgi:hypothetical protein